MVSKRAMDIVWDGLLDVSRYVRYVDKLCSLYQTQRNTAYLLLGISGSSSALAFLEILPGYLTTISNACIAVSLIWFLTLNPGEKASKLSTIKHDIDLLERDYRTMWERLYRGAIEEEEALQEHERLSQNIGQIMTRLDIKTHERLNEKSTEEAFLIEAKRYSSAA